MDKIKLDSQDKIAETMLLVLYTRALEARQPGPLVYDERAVQMVEQIDYNFKQIKLSPLDFITPLLRLRRFDRFTNDFLSRHPSSVVVHIGCGLDTRFERVDNGQVEWYDMDLPEVIAFRQRLVPVSQRCHPLNYSVFDRAWLEAVGKHPGRACLFLAEGVLMYFTEEQVRQLFLFLAESFPGCELVFDGMSAGMIRLHNLVLKQSRVEARLQWGMKDAHQPESWGPGIHLLDEWYYFDEPEPRLGAYRLMRHIPFIARANGIYHYQLGSNS